MFCFYLCKCLLKHLFMFHPYAICPANHKCYYLKVNEALIPLACFEGRGLLFKSWLNADVCVCDSYWNLCGFPQLFLANARIIRGTGHNTCLPHPSQFIIHYNPKV
jgi:hypothetical protein